MNKAQKKPLQLQDSLAVRILICVLFPLIAFAVLLLSQGKSPLVAYQTIITSIFGSAYGFGEVIVRAAYLILTGLAASIPARVGLANAGGEGQMAIAALGTAVAGSTVLANLPGVIGIPLMLLVGMICGALYAGVGVFLKQKLAMNEILTTILMNYVATYLISAMLFGSLRDPNGWNYPQTVEIAPQLRFHTFFGTRMNAGIFVAIAMAGLTWYIIYHTRVGFAVRTIGGNQMAARYAGIQGREIQTWVWRMCRLCRSSRERKPVFGCFVRSDCRRLDWADPGVPFHLQKKQHDGDRVYPDFLCAGPDHLFWKITAWRQPWKVFFPRHSGSEQDSGDWAGLFSAGYSDVYRLCTSGVGLVVPDKNKNGAGALFCGGTA